MFTTDPVTWRIENYPDAETYAKGYNAAIRAARESGMFERAKEYDEEFKRIDAKEVQ